MRKISTFSFCKTISLFFVTACFSANQLHAQTTLTTGPFPPYTGTNSLVAGAQIAFVIENTNAYPILLTGIGNYATTADNNSIWRLFYTATELSGSTTNCESGAWSLVATSSATTVAASGITPLNFTGLSFLIPANTQYRFALENSGPGNIRYTGTGTTCPNLSPELNTFSGGGVNLKNGCAQIAGQNIGWSGAGIALDANTPRYFTGSITFVPALPCVTPPTPGSATATPSTPVCSGASIQLELNGNSIGTGQTYVWQSSSSSGGPFTDISSGSGSSSHTITATTTTWYRAAVTCSGNTQYSIPVQVVVNPAFPGGTYTINSALPTSGSNFQTFTAAVNALSCGISGPVIFNVAAGSGPYTEQVTIPVIGGTSAINTITFNGNGRTLQTTPVTGARHILKLDGADYVTFNNLNIVTQAGSTFGWGVHLANGADWNTINNCTIDISTVTSTTQSNSGGIVGTNSTTSVTAAGNANRNTISNSTIIGAYQGIIINGTATGTLAESNTISNNTIRDFYATGIELTHNDGSGVSFNNIHRTNRAAVGTFAGVELGDGNRNVTVNANRIHDTHTAASTQTGSAYGIFANTCDAPAGSENKVINNLVYKFNSGSGVIYGLYNTGSDGFYYYHNTIVLDNTASTAGTTRGFYQTTTATNIQVKNNIIYITRGGTGAKHCLYFGTTTSTIVSNKNVLYLNAAAGTNGIGSFGTTNYVTLANWQTANGGIYDQQSQSVDPIFVDPNTANYAPSNPAINNTGDNVGVATDILNNPRNVGTPDPGAYEVGPVLGCTDPPIPGTVTSSLNPACSGSDFTLSLTGGTSGTGQIYKWQSSPDNTLWTDIPGATSSTLTTTQTSDTYYRVIVTCGSGTVTSASLLVATELCYCTSIPTSTADTEVWGVSLNGSNNPSDCVTPAPGPGSILNRYSNFYPNGPLATVIPGLTVPFSVAINDCSPPPYYNSGCAIWIDFNRDGDFEDTGEQVYVENAMSLAPRTITGTIAVPPGATVGITGMRVIVAETFSGSGLQPCMSYTYGETEDYLINIISPVPCAGAPTGGSATSSKAVACSGENFILSATGTTIAIGITYQWQSSPDNVNWTNIPGATNLSLTTSQTSSKYYRLVVTCTNSSTSSNSTSVQVLTPALVSGTFTINNALPTGGSNFNSFNDAYNYIKCGINGPVIFNVDAASGPYTEQLIITAVPGASATNTITFNGNGRIIQFLSANTNERAVIKLNGANYYIFDSLTINATSNTASDYGFGIHLMNDADSNIVRNCAINITSGQTSTNHAGIVISASATSATGTGNTMCDDNRFEENVITGGYYGITNVGSSTVANQRNKFIRNIVKDYYLYGFYVNGTFQTQIDGNDISRPARTNLSTGTSYAIYFTGLSTSAKVNGNYIHGLLDANTTSTNDVYGIYFTGVDALSGLDNIVSNNVIYDIESNGTIYGLYNSGSDNVLYFHNTISLDHAASTTTEDTRGFYQTTSAAGIVVMNNIFTLRRGGTGTIHGLYFNTPASGIVSNYNDVFFTPGPNVFYGYSNATDHPILADWQAATGQDGNSLANDPFYENLAAGNLKPTSAVIDDRGVPVGITTDVLGVSRSATTPDIGAYEYASPPCTTPPTPGTATVSATPVCENTLVALNVTGFSIGSSQTYQWQSAVAIAGPYNNISGLATNPTLTIAATETLYYRVAITCGGNTQYSTPVLLTVNPGLPGGTYTIDPGLPPSATNFISFNSAKDAMACGITGPVVFNVEPGTGPYLEQLFLDEIQGTSAINTITFNGAGNAIKFSPTVSADRSVIRLNGTDHTTFNELVIDATGTGAYGWGVLLTNGADSNAFRNCTILANTTATTTNYAGLVISGSATSATSTVASNCDGNVIENNTITGGYYGISLMSSSALPANNNKFINNIVSEFYTYGIHFGYANNTLIEKNTISRPTRATIITFNGIYFNTACSNTLVSRNRITNPTGGNNASTTITVYGIIASAADAAAGQPNIISNNLIYGFNGAGPAYGLYNTGSANYHYYHNTISLDNTASTSASLTRGFYQTTTADGIILKNNIITVTRGGTGTKHALYFNTATSTITSNRNVLFVSGSGTNYIGYNNGASRITLADWQTSSSQDANSVSVDPQYLNPLSGDFTPQQAVTDNIGEPVGILTDINGAARSLTTPDPGAIEFAVVPCTAPTVPGTSTVNPSSGICLGTFVTLNLTGNSTGGFQQYIWQFGPSATGPWQDISDTLYSPQYLYELLSHTNSWFRAVVKCGNGLSYSVPVQVNINPALLAGDYTINPANPPSATNFQSFTTAVAAMQCGIAGSVRFHAVPGTYNEQIIIKKVPGASATSTVTFMSQNGNPASVILSYNSILAASNYVLKLDSASFITFKNISFTATNAVNGRAIEFAGIASKDSILNCNIDVPASSSTSNVIAGIFGTALRGTDIVIKGNTITDGSSNIYLSGTVGSANRFVIDSNILSGAYYYGIYAGGINNINIRKNKATRSGILNTTAYGIYVTNCDSVYKVDDNSVTIENAGTTNYAIYLTGCAANPLMPGSVSRNKIVAVNNVTSATLYGLYQTGSVANYTVNNIIDVNSTGTTVRGLYSTGGGGIRYYNNTVRNSSPSTATTNVAAYFSQTSGTSGVTNIRNNIFYHAGGGVAVYQGNVANIYSDYNMYRTNGTTLILQGTVAYPTLQAWRNAENWDYNSIVYTPAFVTGSSLQPDITNANSWAMHGRGVQITDNASDINGNPRPTTLTTGVPDLGAYEFLPSVNPPVLPGTPASPAANTTQYFMFGTDTVQKITWGATVPTNAEVRRYSGIIPPNLAAGQQSMYFYTDVDITGSTPSSYTLNQYYIDPWMRNIPSEPTVKMGRTNATNNWVVSSTSPVDVFNNVITESGLTFIDKFTGMTDGQAPPPPPAPGFTTDTSNRGRRFWVGYGHHYGFSTNGQTMVLYLSAEQAANVTVKVNGTGWARNYAIPANTVRVSDPLPESGLIDSRILDEGLSNNGISIESDVPIVAYAHIYQGSNSGATMLLPVGTYGYEYRSLNASQYYPMGGAGSYSWFFAIADRDSTLVEITPSVATKGGRPAGVPFQVYLMRGQIYNVMGRQPTAAGTDISGSTIKSIPNASGKCYPIAVFSGSSRTALCYTTNGDNMIQQMFPNSAWGTKYLTFATANAAPGMYNSNKWRVMVKDPATVVKRNGVTLNPSTLVVPGNYYEVGITGGTGASTASYFEADQPIMVAQYMISSDGTGCAGLAGPVGDGDPEMIYISPIEQGIKRAVFYTTDQSAIDSNYINVIIPTTGLASLTIDGSSTFTHVFPHPNLAGYTCIRQNLGGTAGQHIIQSDSAFTAITYGLGNVESYGYNAGTLVKNLSATPFLTNVFSSATSSTYTCKGTPFNLKIQISVKPTQLIWNLSQVPNISPNTNVTQSNPVPADSVTLNGKKFYIYTLPQNYTFSAVGNYVIPITVFHPSIEGCGGSIEITLPVSVIAAPVSDFTVSVPNCVNEQVQFNATTITSNGVPVNQWTWNFGDNTTGNGQNPVHTYSTAGTFNVALRGIANDGCIGDTTKSVVINAKPTPVIVQDTVYVCNNANATFNVQNPIAGATYSWYSAATAGTLLGTGTSVTVNNVTGFVNVYLEAAVNGCISVTRDRATAAILPTLAAPVVVVDSVGVNTIRFRWNTVPNATGYEVSINNGVSWAAPSSGSTGLTHTVSGLTLGATVNLQVRALGGCLPAVSAAVAGQTRTDQVYIPNSFTPNGDGRNDVLRVYSNVIRSMKIVIFNQWGEKVYESTDQNMAWDGTFKNKPQPSGVYIYVAEIIINTGEKISRKGSINLVR